MASYVTSFVVPVPKKKLEAYQAMAKKMGKVWMKHGALSYTECVEDDVEPGEVTSFPRSVKLKKGEVVVFAWATYKSRAHRDKVMKAAMADPIFDDMDMENMPFDGMRMFWGGFTGLVEMGWGAAPDA